MAKKNWQEQLAEAKAKLGLENPSSSDGGARTPPPPPTRRPGADYSSPLSARRLQSLQKETGVTPEPVPPKPKRFADREWIVRSRHRRFLASRSLPYKGSTSLRAKARRTDVCYNCKHTVDSFLHELCDSCTIRNIICPDCGACGCGYGDVGRSAPADGWFSDDVEIWLETRNGQVVIPTTAAGAGIDYNASDAGRRRAAYAAFLRSSTWHRLRNGALKSARFRCEECGEDSAGSLQVHHLTYERVGGHELPEDLQVLCEDCHYFAHDYATAYARYISGAQIGTG